MSQTEDRFQQVFFEVYEQLPRQGPGSRFCTAKALRFCRDLPSFPSVLDLGCGTGAQTLCLAELTSGPIIAIDSHFPAIQRLNATLNKQGLSQRVQAKAADMSRLNMPAESFDLVWSEGALYNTGIGSALRICRRLLRPGGYIAFTDAVWRVDDPPPEIRKSFQRDYPDMGRVKDIEMTIRDCGFRQLGSFFLPDEAWWDEFYSPMERCIAELRGKYAGDEQATDILKQLALEPELHRRYSYSYAYVFFIARCP